MNFSKTFDREGTKRIVKLLPPKTNRQAFCPAPLRSRCIGAMSDCIYFFDQPDRLSCHIDPLGKLGLCQRLFDPGEFDPVNHMLTRRFQLII